MYISFNILLLIKIKKYIIRFLIYFDFYESYRTVRSHLPIK